MGSGCRVMSASATRPFVCPGLDQLPNLGRQVVARLHAPLGGAISTAVTLWRNCHINGTIKLPRLAHVEHVRFDG